MEYSLVYAHAIFGILTISLAFSQVAKLNQNLIFKI